ncbi:inositol monophosphatase family protein [Streptomyces sp. RB6PN25]|uniref:inositol-phosphate phosphatase n=1 Tax=Streptomyces humicola TaxID=2953240 RepID=A0ABT1PUF3_9ACTN|nr:inositol monophosphatase family protein [Streptomyces humicola]MCQ4081304.1 inositol monophosphatase family protein [Streptomyces humicola]
MPDLASLLPVAHEAVDRARKRVLAAPAKTVQSKGDRDMVSDVDLAVESELCEFLAKETPDIGFFGEENGSYGEGRDFTWVLDPLDGTANFLSEIPLCGISLGLLSNRESVLGVIDLPFLASRFSAAQGLGSFCGERQVFASRKTQLHDAIVSVGDYAVGIEAATKNRVRLAITRLLSERAQRVRMLGSAAIDLAWVAAGKLDASIMLSNHPWDTAAGVAIAKEAGALVVDLDGSAHNENSAATIAVAPALRDEVLHLLRDATSDA